MSDLPPIPLDDEALDAIEHALGAVYTFDDHEQSFGLLDSEPILTGADYTLDQLLDFWSGFDRSKGVLTGYAGDAPIYTFDQPTYSERDLIRDLIAEVRRLRKERS